MVSSRNSWRHLDTVRAEMEPGVPVPVHQMEISCRTQKGIVESADWRLCAATRCSVDLYFWSGSICCTRFYGKQLIVSNFVASWLKRILSCILLLQSCLITSSYYYVFESTTLHMPVIDYLGSQYMGVLMLVLIKHRIPQDMCCCSGGAATSTEAFITRHP